MLRFIDDVAGAIADFFKIVFTGFCYLLAGALIVGLPLYAISFIFHYTTG
ncbi:hypothetical protein [Jeotgalibacillus malaysiensis]